MINKIYQKHRTGCSVASIAMLAGISYSEAIKALYPNHKKYQKNVSGNIMTILMAFSRLGIKTDVKFAMLKPVDIKSIDKPALLCIYLGDKTSRNHAVVWDPEQQKILNPDPIRKRDLPIKYYQNRLCFALILK